MKKLKISFNSPVVLGFILVSLAVLILGFLTLGKSNELLFMTYHSALTNPLTYLRFFTHVLGHSGWEHYIGNASDAEDFRNCYWNSLEVAKANDLHSIAFPGISTGVYGYPKKEAAKIALKTVKEWLESNSAYEMEITIVNFSEEDYLIYQTVAAEMG